jgi:hypothetical protein
MNPRPILGEQQANAGYPAVLKMLDGLRYLD